MPPPRPHRATLLAMLLAALSASGQNVITTVAGADWLFPGDGRPALQAPLSGTLSLDVTIDRAGNYLIADHDNGMVLRVGSDGIINIVAGNGFNGTSGDGGQAVAASLAHPTAVAVDAAGNLYIGVLPAIRKVTPDGVISTIAGTNVAGFSGDNGPATLAQLDRPSGLAFDAAGNLFFSDSNNNRIRRISNGIITTVAGTGQQGSAGDNGPALAAQFNRPSRLAFDASGALYVSDPPNGRVRKIVNGVITTVAGGGSSLADGVPATTAKMIPLSIAFDTAGNLYVGDRQLQAVRKVNPQGVITTIAGGSGIAGFSGDGGPALSATFNFGAYPSLAVDTSNNIFVGDDQNRRVRKITPDGKVNTVAGNGLYRFAGDGGPAPSATLYTPVSVLGAGGNIYFSEQAQHRIRRVAPDGTISVFAGTGALGFAGDNGPAVNASLSFPTYLAMDAAGSLYVSDTGNGSIRKIDKSGRITTFVGTGKPGFNGDGLAATKTMLNSPYGIALDAGGNLFIADTNINVIRANFADGSGVLIVAGNGSAGFSGDNGPSQQAVLNHPVGLLYLNGSIYFCDSLNHRVRRIRESDTTISTIAGNGKAGFSGDGGLATLASLNNPQGLTADAAGNLYVADQSNFVVRKITPGGIISTVAGNPNPTTLGDGGPATSAYIASPTDVSFNAAGDLLIADFNNARIRSVLASRPTFQVSPTTLSFLAPAGTASLDQDVTVNSAIPGLPFTATVVNAPWLSVSPSSATMPATLRVTADPSAQVPAATLQGTINITALSAAIPTVAISVTLNTTNPTQPSLSLRPSSMVFSLVQGGAASTRALAISNFGAVSVPFQLAASTSSGGAWLRTSTASGAVAAFASTQVSVIADPTGLPPGTYSGTVTASNSNPAVQAVTLAVTMTVTAVQQTILVPQTGLTFFAVQGGGATLPQFFNILNTGRGQMQWTVKSSTLSGGSWLSAFPANGTSDAASPLVPVVRVSVSPLQLGPGVYSGTVQVTAPGADNSPQFVSVFLNVLPPGSKIGPLVQPSALIFSAVAGGQSPGSQSVVVQSLSTTPLTFHSACVTLDGANWCQTLPPDGVVTQAQPQRIVVQPAIGGLAAGVYRGTLTLAFSDGSTRNVALVLVILPAGSAGPSPARAAAACTPSKLAPVFTLFANGFQVAVGFPNAIAVKVVDDCGNFQTTGSVTASFNNGDSPFQLTSLKDGTWAGTWTPAHLTTSVAITATAAIPEQNVQGQVQVQGGFLSLDLPPVVASGAVVNAASFAVNSPVAPGSLISIFGSKLAVGLEQFTTVPLPTTLAGSGIVLGGIPAPLTFANETQVNAQVPYETAVNTAQQVLVTRGSSYSAPMGVTVAAAAPGVFTFNGTGMGQGLIFIADPSGAQLLADSSHPAKAGDVVVIYCTGLGQVSPPVASGAMASLTTLSTTVNQATVTIGGAPSTVGFSGLTPGFVGLYQVNATVPSGIAPGDQVPLVITVASQSSRPVTMSLR